MAFVRGHARATGWVKAHIRAPNRAVDGQLALLPALLPPLDERIPRQLTLEHVRAHRKRRRRRAPAGSS
ncbi:hypothetical protein SAMN05443637_102297 [Pseudonocardia thermophila]|jgi:hypothetical protein|uniref:Uncharacterized protein n=1 Tax=Pseudonocardia thermophila TaxID=1848 RepID=A0A1M6PJ25_PSETH|nr:hypothetical protein [Pseudonocardia thermophila]SHK07936.1 hypothetical protein SAMN05443637_102297 [Pseudonocardia thermophila]